MAGSYEVTQNRSDRGAGCVLEAKSTDHAKGKQSYQSHLESDRPQDTPRLSLSYFATFHDTPLKRMST